MYSVTETHVLQGQQGYDVGAWVLTTAFRYLLQSVHQPLRRPMHESQPELHKS